MRRLSKYLIIIYIAALLLPVLPARAAGTASVSVDLSAVGCGSLVPPTEIETDGTLRASEAILRVLADSGYTAFYGGSPTDSFYLAYVADGGKTGSFNGYRSAGELYPVPSPKPLGISPRIPQRVSAYLEANADYFDPADYETNFAGYLGEFVFTNGSGWMYSLNGAFLQKDLASVTLSPGDTLTLQYTLWYGADVGGAEPQLQASFDAALAAMDAGTEAPPETTSESTAAESTTEALTTQETATTERTTEESTTEEITTEESTTEETTTEESTAEESTAEESAAEESTAEESAAEESTTEESATEALPETDTAPEAKNKTSLYWVIPAAAAVPVTALAVVMIKKYRQKKETENQ